MSSNHSNHYLFGLHPSKLSVIPGKDAVRLRKFEGKLWRIPKISAKLIKALRPRFQKPHHYVLQMPFYFITSQDTPIYSIPQYVRILSLVNSQLLKVHHEKVTGSKLSIPTFEPLKHLILSCKTHNNFSPSYNDKQVDLVVHQLDAAVKDNDLAYAYSVWANTHNPKELIQTVNYEFGYTPFFRSLTNAGCVILTSKAAHLYKFAEDYCITMDNLNSQCFKSTWIQHAPVKPTKAAKKALTHLRHCDPAMYKRYHRSIIQQVHYTFRINRNREA